MSERAGQAGVLLKKRQQLQVHDPSTEQHTQPSLGILSLVIIVAELDDKNSTGNSGGNRL